MKSLRLSALLFILGCISMFVACNKEVASELPKVSSIQDVSVEERGINTICPSAGQLARVLCIPVKQLHSVKADILSDAGRGDNPDICYDRVTKEI